ncbi:hypothetical protein Nepgr_015086 [Nepenthes gracilis]|uniref:Uncharacterized protein n=1 Tax=Nepenthes gracilis TaxID=150966 RepID=A0AAD3XR42_NEPGR|nr:hypothetical protein Nepgr_015086 [Nepenthes gracilis]
MQPNPYSKGRTTSYEAIQTKTHPHRIIPSHASAARGNPPNHKAIAQPPLRVSSEPFGLTKITLGINHDPHHYHQMPKLSSHRIGKRRKPHRTGSIAPNNATPVSPSPSPRGRNKKPEPHQSQATSNK